MDKKTLIILIMLVLLFASSAGCIGKQVYDAGTGAAGSVHQSVEDVDKDTCCKTDLKNNIGCFCPETTTFPVNVTPSIEGK
jgi:hypothetical protein